jgi:putative transposase
MSKINKQIRKKHSSKVKFQVVLETLREDQSITEVARTYGIHANMITRWRTHFLGQGHKIFESDAKGAGKAQDKKIEELEKIIGKQTVEISLLKKFLGHYRSD